MDIRPPGGGSGSTDSSDSSSSSDSDEPTQDDFDPRLRDSDSGSSDDSDSDSGSSSGSDQPTQDDFDPRLRDDGSSDSGSSSEPEQPTQDDFDPRLRDSDSDPEQPTQREESGTDAGVGGNRTVIGESDVERQVASQYGHLDPEHVDARMEDGNVDVFLTSEGEQQHRQYIAEQEGVDEDRIRFDDTTIATFDDFVGGDDDDFDQFARGHFEVQEGDNFEVSLTERGFAEYSRQQIAAEDDDVSIDDIVIGDDNQLRFSDDYIAESFVDQVTENEYLRRERADDTYAPGIAAPDDVETDTIRTVAISEDDVVIEDGEARLSDSALQQYQTVAKLDLRAEAAEEARSKAVDQLAEDIDGVEREMTAPDHAHTALHDLATREQEGVITIDESDITSRDGQLQLSDEVTTQIEDRQRTSALHQAASELDVGVDDVEFQTVDRKEAQQTAGYTVPEGTTREAEVIGLTDDAREEKLREQIEEEYPDAEFEISEEDGELVAEIEGEEGGPTWSDIKGGIRNPVGAVESITQRGVETGESALDIGTKATLAPAAVTASFITDPKGTAEIAAESVGDFSGKIVSEGKQSVDSFQSVVNDPVEHLERGYQNEIGVAREGVNFGSEVLERAKDSKVAETVAVSSAAVVTPEPVSSGAGTIGLAGAGIATAGIAGAVAYDRYLSQESGESASISTANVVQGGEIDVNPGDLSQGEITVPASGVAIESEIETPNPQRTEFELPEGIEEDNVEISVPDSVDESEVVIEDGRVIVPAEVGSAVAEQITEEEAEKEDEEEEEEEKNQWQVIIEEEPVEVPEEMIPEGTVVLGEVEPEVSEEELQEEIQIEEEYQGVDDVTPEDSWEEGEFDETTELEEPSFGDKSTGQRVKDITDQITGISVGGAGSGGVGADSDQQTDIDFELGEQTDFGSGTIEFADEGVELDLAADTALDFSHGIEAGADTGLDTGVDTGFAEPTEFGLEYGFQTGRSSKRRRLRAEWPELESQPGSSDADDFDLDSDVWDNPVSENPFDDMANDLEEGFDDW